MNDCLFCKIANKELSTYSVYEDEYCLAFLDISQQTIGHTLVVPKKHFDNLLDIDEITLKHLIMVAQKIAKGLSKLEGVKGVNLLNNCGVIAGQSIMHFHIHVIPRYEKDDVVIKGKGNELSPNEFADLTNKIKNEL